jgi:hypothetical protein
MHVEGYKEIVTSIRSCLKGVIAPRFGRYIPVERFVIVKIGRCRKIKKMLNLLAAAEASYAVASPCIFKPDVRPFSILFFETYRLNSIRIVSIVNSRFHCTKHGSLVGST